MRREFFVEKRKTTGSWAMAKKPVGCRAEMRWVKARAK